MARKETLLGLHERTCRTCRTCSPASDRLVTRRQYGLFAAGLPVLTLDAVWTGCTGCDDTSAVPRFSLGTSVTLTFLVLFLLGQGWLGMNLLAAGFALSAVWLLWFEGKIADLRLRRRLVPLPTRTLKVAKDLREEAAARPRARRA